MSHVSKIWNFLTGHTTRWFAKQIAKQELEEIIQGCKDQKATANRKLKQPLRLFGKRYVQSKITQIAECEENIKLPIKNISDAIKCI